MSSVIDYQNTMGGALSGASTGALAGSVIPGIGTAVGAGIGLIGGALSNIFNKKQADRGYAQQKEALQHSIRWRVADAKAAGIHPLYAMGAPSLNMTPIVQQDNIGPAVQNMGQSMADITKNTMSENMKAQQFAEMQLLSSQRNKNDAEAELARTQAMRLMTEKNNINPPGLGVKNESGQNPTGGGAGFYEVKPAEQTSQKIGMPESSAGENPSLQLRRLFGGQPMFMDIAEGDSPEETWKEKSIPASIGMLLNNQRIFGGDWLKDYIKSRYLGLKVTGKYEKYNLNNPDWWEQLQRDRVFDKKLDWIKALPYKALPPEARKKYMSPSDMKKRYNLK